MSNPTLATSAVFAKANKVVKLEFLPFPNVTADFHVNHALEVLKEQLRDLWTAVGPVVLTGFVSTFTAPFAWVTTGGRFLVDGYDITLADFNVTTSAGIDQEVVVRVTETLLTFATDPATIGFALPGYSGSKGGANQYRYAAAVVQKLVSAATPTPVAPQIKITDYRLLRFDTTGTRLVEQLRPAPDSARADFISSPAALAADANNFDPGVKTSVLRLSGTASRSVTGFAGGSLGRRLLVLNVGTFSLTLDSNSTASTAANRFTFPGPIVLGAFDSALLLYDVPTQRWVSAGSSGSQSRVFRAPSFSVDRNDFSPTGFEGASVLELQPTVDRILLSGLDSSRFLNRALTLRNVGTGSLILLNSTFGGASLAANRFALPAGINYWLAPDDAITLFCPNAATGWVVLNLSRPRYDAMAGWNAIPAANDIDIASVPGPLVNITGATDKIISLGTPAPGTWRFITFEGRTLLQPNDDVSPNIYLGDPHNTDWRWLYVEAGMYLVVFNGNQWVFFCDFTSSIPPGNSDFRTEPP